MAVGDKGRVGIELEFHSGAGALTRVFLDHAGSIPCLVFAGTLNVIGSKVQGQALFGDRHLSHLKRAVVAMNPLRRADLPVGTMELAQYLIGKTLVHELPAARLSGVIVETEEYQTGDDAGHDFRGKTRGNK